MRKRLLGTIITLLAGAGLAWSQAPAGPAQTAESPSSASTVPSLPIVGEPILGSHPARTAPPPAPVPPPVPPARVTTPARPEKPAPPPPAAAVPVEPLPRVGAPLMTVPRPRPIYQEPPPPPPAPAPVARVTATLPAEPAKPAAASSTPPPDLPIVGAPVLSDCGYAPYAGACNSSSESPRPCKVKPPEEYKSHFWFAGEYLLWWVRDARLPPLLTTSSLTSSIVVNGSVINGVLGAPGTSVLLGNSPFDYGSFSGGRLSAGFISESEVLGLEGSVFLLGGRTARFGAASDAAGSPVIVRPFINAQTNTETGFVVSLPGAFNGTVSVTSSSQLWGSEVNGVLLVLGNCHANVEALLGFRYCDLAEDLSFSNQTSFLLPGGITFLNGVPFLTPNRDTLNERFATHNQFYGGQIGAQAEFRLGSFYLDLVSKIAIGSTHQVITIGGTTTLTEPNGVTQTASGGLLALASNSGRFSHDVFSVIPEVQVQVGYQICKNLRAFAGYNFLYWSDVARPADQINRSVNETQLPTSQTFGPLVGPALPSLPFRQTPFWAHGLDVGLALRF